MQLGDPSDTNIVRDLALQEACGGLEPLQGFLSALAFFINGDKDLGVTQVAAHPHFSDRGKTNTRIFKTLNK